MTKVVADITVSLDGFVATPDGDVDALHVWALRPDAIDKAVLTETVDATGAVIMGRAVYDVVDAPGGWSDEMGYGGAIAAAPPVLVVTSSPPEKVRLTDRFTFVVDGIGSAVAKAAALADDRDVVIMGGATVIRTAVEAGLVGELRLHVAPVLLGAGIPLFTGQSRPLRQLHVRASAQATHLTYRVD